MSSNQSMLPIQAEDAFHFDEARPDFNALSRQNGFVCWYGRDLMRLLGYQDWRSFRQVIQKAMAACMALDNIDIAENFLKERRRIHGKEMDDFKLSRFACYLVAMNGDSKKTEVARAQAYFATIAEAFRKYVEEAEEIERILVREEITDHEKTLAGTAKQAGVEQYAFFQNAGYLGMYNMGIKALRNLKGVPANRSPLDFMGKVELAANLFRVTQTEEKIRNEGIEGQKRAEKAAQDVGKEVRDTMKRISGTVPEELPPAEDIRKVKGDIKHSEKEFARMDKPSR
uniref:DNA-damage-inducible protein D n=1 Tax=Candidatus Kentrum eta TaxID=2126337 RepID=A0A450VD13_9GAMM|nr:MAG: DNA-damage-inducible protein D [Candidatus Kentron sp. H]VFK02686.1 MAG: DNA-damage-inducible protein D [Candidatus Kentron sp. H]VFK05778.1 MAG: DNA-damage-inducible protein D [Candidatus Kentron sp. H]